jgi:hypothetical protein
MRSGSRLLVALALDAPDDPGAEVSGRDAEGVGQLDQRASGIEQLA